MEIRKHQAFWRGAMLLTAAALITKILSAFYRIPYQNIAGDRGFYIYQQAYPFYGLCLVLTVYGFPSVISRLVAERSQREEQAAAAVWTAFRALAAVGVLAFAGLFYAAAAIAAWMGDKQLTPLLQVTSFCFLLMPFLAAVRGYFQGFSHMTPTALSQVGDQFVRVTVIILVSLLLLAEGADLYAVGAAAMSGSVAGSVIGAVILAACMKKYGVAFMRRSWLEPFERGVVRTVLWQGIAVCISHLALILLQFIDSLSLYSLLLQAGEDGEQAKVIKGVYDRGIPLLQLGAVVATSFSLSLIPVITGARQRGDKEAVQHNLYLGLRAALAVGAGAAIGLICIIHPTNIMLFEDDNGSFTLGILALAIVFQAITITVVSILQSLGCTGWPALFVGLGAVVKYIGNLLLVPGFGVNGAAAATVLGLVVAGLLNMLLLSRTAVLPSLRNTVGKVAAACGGMAAVLFLYMHLLGLFFDLQQRSNAAIGAITAVMVGGGVFVWLIVQLRVFTRKELAVLLQRDS